MDYLSEFSFYQKEEEKNTIVNHNNQEEIFHMLSIEELNIKTETLKDLPVQVEMILNPKSQTFNLASNPFTISSLTCVLKIIGFTHNSSLEIYLNILKSIPEDRYYSISFELFFNTTQINCLITVNPGYKDTYFLHKSPAKYPLKLFVKTKYEKNHSILFRKILDLENITIEDAKGILDNNKFELLLHSSKLKVKNEDEVLNLIGV